MQSLDYYRRRIEERRNAMVLRALGLMTRQSSRLSRRRRQLEETARHLGGLVRGASPVTPKGPSPIPEPTPLDERLSNPRWRVREEAAKEAARLPELDETTRARLLELLEDEQWLVARAALFALLAHEAVEPEHSAVRELLEGPNKAAFDLELLREVA